MYKIRRQELLQALSQSPSHDSIVLTASFKRRNADLGKKSFRGSVYRGVSKNKLKWQVIINIITKVFTYR
jgi:hypothetical protein